MTRILGISGSLRAGSYNTALLRNAATLLPGGVELQIVTLHGIPLYDGDVEEREGIPATVNALKERIGASQGVILATPEYNNSVPGVLKNTVDWLSRPPAEIARVFGGGRAWATIGASAGGFGTVLSQHEWLGVLRHLGCRLWTGSRVMVSRSGQAFDAQGQLVDESARKALREFLAGFAGFAAQR